MIRSAGRFGSDGGKVESLLDTYVFVNANKTVAIFTDAEEVLLRGLVVETNVDLI